MRRGAAERHQRHERRGVAASLTPTPERPSARGRHGSRQSGPGRVLSTGRPRLDGGEHGEAVVRQEAGGQPDAVAHRRNNDSRVNPAARRLGRHPVCPGARLPTLERPAPARPRRSGRVAPVPRPASQPTRRAVAAQPVADDAGVSGHRPARAGHPHDDRPQSRRKGRQATQRDAGVIVSVTGRQEPRAERPHEPRLEGQPVHRRSVARPGRRVSRVRAIIHGQADEHDAHPDVRPRGGRIPRAISSA